MWLGLAFAISACFIWGAIFVIPQFLSDFSPIEVVLGRYFAYGILSCALFFRKGFSKARFIPQAAWITALKFALFANICYYLGIVVGIRFASAPLTVLVTGMVPILIALYGNWHVREISFKKLALPCVCIAFGLMLVNATEIDWSFTENSLQEYLLGLVGVLVALLSWTWFAVHNARFLKLNPTIVSSDWATIVGVCTFFWTLLLGTVFAFFFEGHVEIGKFFHWSDDLARFLIGAGVLGFVCSWMGIACWNRASLYLPVSLMGPFLIFESLFGLLFVYTVDSRLPSLLEILGIVSMMGGIILSVLSFRRQKLVH